MVSIENFKKVHIIIAKIEKIFNNFHLTIKMSQFDSGLSDLVTDQHYKVNNLLKA